MSDKPNLSSLDTFSRKYLMGTDTQKDVYIAKGEDGRTDKVQEAYFKQVQEDFIERAGGFTEDLIGFIIEQRKKRDLDDKSVIFALALANINLHSAYCSPQNEKEKKAFDKNRKDELNREWDEICWAAQCYFDENNT